jgi:hypothetical protein
VVRQAQQQIANVLMDEAQGAHADQDKQQGLSQFEGRNKQ